MKKNILGDAIKRLRKERGMTQTELSKHTGYSQNTISNHENGNRMIDEIAIHKYAEAFHIPPAELFTSTPTLEILGRVDSMDQYPYIPAPIAAGFPTTIEGINEFLTISVPSYLLGKYKNNPHIVIARASGDSMNRVIPDQGYIAIYFGYPVENLCDGDIVVFSCDGDYSMKRYYDFEDKIVFRPDSYDPTYTDIVCQKDERLTIIGKVVMYSVVLE